MIRLVDMGKSSFKVPFGKPTERRKKKVVRIVKATDTASQTSTSSFDNCVESHGSFPDLRSEPTTYKTTITSRGENPAARADASSQQDKATNSTQTQYPEISVGNRVNDIIPGIDLKSMTPFEISQLMKHLNPEKVEIGHRTLDEHGREIVHMHEFPKNLVQVYQQKLNKELGLNYNGNGNCRASSNGRETTRKEVIQRHKEVRRQSISPASEGRRSVIRQERARDYNIERGQRKDKGHYDTRHRDTKGLEPESSQSDENYYEKSSCRSNSTQYVRGSRYDHSYSRNQRRNKNYYERPLSSRSSVSEYESDRWGKERRNARGNSCKDTSGQQNVPIERYRYDIQNEFINRLLTNIMQKDKVQSQQQQNTNTAQQTPAPVQCSMPTATCTRYHQCMSSPHHCTAAADCVRHFPAPTYCNAPAMGYTGFIPGPVQCALPAMNYPGYLPGTVPYMPPPVDLARYLIPAMDYARCLPGTVPTTDSTRYIPAPAQSTSRTVDSANNHQCCGRLANTFMPSSDTSQMYNFSPEQVQSAVCTNNSERQRSQVSGISGMPRTSTPSHHQYSTEPHHACMVSRRSVKHQEYSEGPVHASVSETKSLKEQKNSSKTKQPDTRKAPVRGPDYIPEHMRCSTPEMDSLRPCQRPQSAVQSTVETTNTRHQEYSQGPMRSSSRTEQTDRRERYSTGLVQPDDLPVPGPVQCAPPQMDYISQNQTPVETTVTTTRSERHQDYTNGPDHVSTSSTEFIKEQRCPRGSPGTNRTVSYAPTPQTFNEPSAMRQPPSYQPVKTSTLTRLTGDHQEYTDGPVHISESSTHSISRQSVPVLQTHATIRQQPRCIPSTVPSERNNTKKHVSTSPISFLTNHQPTQVPRNQTVVPAERENQDELDKIQQKNHMALVSKIESVQQLLDRRYVQDIDALKTIMAQQYVCIDMADAMLEFLRIRGYRCKSVPVKNTASPAELNRI